MHSGLFVLPLALLPFLTVQWTPLEETGHGGNPLLDAAGDGRGKPSRPLATSTRIFTGAASGDYFGCAAVCAGDVNGDGYSDLIVGAYMNDAGGTESGRAYIYFGGPSTDNVADKVLTGIMGAEHFGFSVAAAGDVNGDGYGDVIVGAPASSAGAYERGRAYIYFGGVAMDTTADVVMNGVAALDDFGRSVAGVGDVNHDGYSDVIVGASNNDAAGTDAGRAYLYLGGAIMDSTTDVVFTGAAAGDYFGTCVAGAGDMNNDGYDDVIIGALGNSAAGSEAGRAYIYFGGASVDSTADVILTGAAADDWFGASVAAAGDVNGDGYGDVIVGAEGNDAGKARIYFGGATVDSTADVIFAGATLWDWFGSSVAGAGDVNGDGYSDIIVGAFGNDAAGSSAGRAYVYFGGATMDTAVDAMFTGAAANDLFGRPVAGAGDVNGDGYSEVIAGAEWNDAGGTNAGRAYLYIGPLPAPEGLPEVLSFTPTRNALNANKNANVSIVFSQSMDPSTLSAASVKVHGSLSGLRSCVFSYNAPSKTATIDPSIDFGAGEVITVALLPGIRNTWGDSLTNPQSWSFMIRTSEASRVFTLSSATAVGSHPVSVTPGDFDRDGDIDLVVADYALDSVSVLLNNGSGTFSKSSKSAVGSNPSGIASGDLDADGDLDLAVANFNSSNVSILTNNGSGAFAPTSTLTVGGYSTWPAMPLFVVAADVDGDADLDLAVFKTDWYYDTRTVSILLNNGSGAFAQGDSLNIDSPPDWYSIPTAFGGGDLDADGDFDLVAATKNEGVRILRNNGSGTFTQESPLSTEFYPWSIVVGDFDGDGDLDLSVGFSLYASIFLNNGSGVFALHSQCPVGYEPLLSSGDFDGDGDLDLAALDNSDGNLALLVNDGSAGFTVIPSSGVGATAPSITTADVDGDGDPDLAVTAAAYVAVFKNAYLSAAISGHAYFDVNGNGMKDAAEAWMSNLRMVLGGAKTDTGTTDALGFFRFSGLGPAGYTVREILPVGWVCTTPPGYIHSVTLLGEDTASGKDFGNYCLGYPPITAVVDVPNDQGGKLRMTWHKARLDTTSASPQIASYGVWRRIPPGGAAFTRAPMSLAKETNDTLGLLYDLVAVIPAVQSPVYNVVIQTLSDSSASGTHRYKFLVTAHTADPNLFFLSAEDSGYSVDNLPPGAPGGSDINPLFGGPLQLSWSPNTSDRDLSHYSVYRSTSPGFTPASANRLRTTTDTTAVDSSTTPGNSYFYRITCVDIHDNQSLPTPELSAVALAVDLTGLTASAVVRNTVMLEWRTATEKSNLGFEVQRRAENADEWAVLGFVEGAGTSNVPHTYSYRDQNLQPGTYCYRLRQVSTNGSSAYTWSATVKIGVPAEFALHQNYPNPFNPTTAIEYDLPREAGVQLKIYDNLGREVRTMVDAVQPAGYYKLVLDAQRLSSGIYYYRLQAGTFVKTRKMLILK